MCNNFIKDLKSEKLRKDTIKKVIRIKNIIIKYLISTIYASF